MTPFEDGKSVRGPQELGVFSGRHIRFVTGAVILATGGLLYGCGDMVDNALGINGSPAWNIPLQLEGTWTGQPIPEVRFLVDCFQTDTMTKADIPQFAVSIKDGTVTGALVFADGARFDIIGKTLAGTELTGHNIADGDIFYRKHEVGHFGFEPDGFSGRMIATHIYFDRPDTGGRCAFSDVVMNRKT